MRCFFLSIRWKYELATQSLKMNSNGLHIEFLQIFNVRKADLTMTMFIAWFKVNIDVFLVFLLLTLNIFCTFCKFSRSPLMKKCSFCKFQPYEILSFWSRRFLTMFLCKLQQRYLDLHLRNMFLKHFSMVSFIWTLVLAFLSGPCTWYCI